MSESDGRSPAGGDRLTRIETILERVAVQQSVNTNAISRLTEKVEGTRSKLKELITDLRQIAAKTMQSIAESNRRIDETNQRIEQLYRDLTNRNGGSPPPE